MRTRARSARTTVIALTAVATITLAACSGGGSETDADSGAGDGDGSVTLTFAASTFGDPGRGPGLEEWIGKFNASQDDVTENKEAATTFLEWMLESENQKDLQLVLGASSVATVTERTEEELAVSPFLPVVDELTDSSLPQVVAGYEAKTPDIRSIVIEQVLRALAGEVDMQTAMDTAQEMAVSAVG